MSGTSTLPRRAESTPDGNPSGMTAFITAPVSVDVWGVRQILERRGIKTFTADELDLPGRPLSEILQEGMSRADIVVGVLGSGTSSENVFFELGFAQAMKKRMLVLGSGDAPLSTWASTGIPYVRAELTNPQAVDFAVAQILKVPHHGSTRETPVRRTRPLGEAADRLLSKLIGATGEKTAQVMEEVVVEAVRQCGIDTVSQSGRRDGGVDLAVWSEDFEPWVNNPLLIEVKANIGSATAWEEVVLNLLRTMGSTGVRWSLLIYLHSPLDPAQAIRAPNILAISAEEFLRALQGMSFGELVRKLRNERVHGAR
ncbi:MAG: restriction endonuclease [Isosphaeraceae bacterium]|jgi:hypothetical protein